MNTYYEGRASKPFKSSKSSKSSRSAISESSRPARPASSRPANRHRPEEGKERVGLKLSSLAGASSGGGRRGAFGDKATTLDKESNKGDQNGSVPLDHPVIPEGLDGLGSSSAQEQQVSIAVEGAAQSSGEEVEEGAETAPLLHQNGKSKAAAT